MEPRKTRSKKAQLKMGETMAIMLIFFILIGLGLIFYSGVQKTLTKANIEESFEKRAVLVAQRVTFLPEVQCSFKNNIKESCFDVYKLNVLAQLVQDDEVFLFYRRDFEDSLAIIKEVYPGDGEWVIFNNTVEGFTTAIPTYIPISIYNASKHDEEAYSFGYLEVTIYK